MDTTKPIAFTINPVRVVQADPGDPWAYIDEEHGRQVADHTTVLVEGDVEGEIYYSGALDPEDVTAVQSILRAVATTRAAAVLAEREACAMVATDRASMLRRTWLMGESVATAEKIAADIRARK